MQTIIILGTDTDVGKTFVAAAMASLLVGQGERVGTYKPVASGVSRDGLGDAERLWRAADLINRVPLQRVCPQEFVAPLAPPVAARLEGKQVDESLLVDGATWWRGQCDILIIEGAGGALSPVSENQTNLDMVAALNKTLGPIPSVIIAPQRLGVVNHSLLTIEAMQLRELPLIGLFLNAMPVAATTTTQNQPTLASNVELIRRFAPNCPIFTELNELIFAIRRWNA